MILNIAEVTVGRHSDCKCNKLQIGMFQENMF